MVLLKEPVQPLPRSSLLYNNASNSSSRIKETRKVKLLYNPLTKRQILNNFEILATLGNGQYGKVKLARDLGTGALVAIKILNRFEKRSGYSLQLKVENPRVNQEIEVMKRCHHENVVELYEILNDPESTKVYLVLEYAQGDPLMVSRKQNGDKSSGTINTHFPTVEEGSVGCSIGSGVFTFPRDNASRYQTIEPVNFIKRNGENIRFWRCYVNCHRKY